jgi:hypothetical protein
MAAKGTLESELAECELRLRDYTQGLEMLKAYDKTAKSGHDEISAWILAARNLVNRAEASLVLLKDRAGRGASETGTEGRRILAELNSLRTATEAATAVRIKPSRTAEMMAWMYDSMEDALGRAVAAADGRAAKSR